MVNPVQRVVVTVDDRNIDSLDRLVADLERQGLRDIQTMPHIGIITGAIQSTQVTALAQVPGVTAVEPDNEMRAI